MSVFALEDEEHAQEMDFLRFDNCIISNFSLQEFYSKHGPTVSLLFLDDLPRLPLVGFSIMPAQAIAEHKLRINPLVFYKDWNTWQDEHTITWANRPVVKFDVLRILIRMDTNGISVRYRMNCYPTTCERSFDFPPGFRSAYLAIAGKDIFEPKGETCKISIMSAQQMMRWIAKKKQSAVSAQGTMLNSSEACRPPQMVASTNAVVQPVVKFIFLVTATGRVWFTCGSCRLCGCAEMTAVAGGTGGCGCVIGCYKEAVKVLKRGSSCPVCGKRIIEIVQVFIQSDGSTGLGCKTAIAKDRKVTVTKNAPQKCGSKQLPRRIVTRAMQEFAAPHIAAMDVKPSQAARTVMRDFVTEVVRKDIVCIEESRVRLTWPPDNSNDYIHANWVKKLGGMDKEIICTQAPMTSTIADFWRMVWQEKCIAVVMLCRVVENGRPKCVQYWPLKLNQTMSVCGLHIKNDGVEEIPNEIIYTRLILSGPNENGGERTQIVRHVLWNGWPDKGVPRSTTGALRLIIRTQTLSPVIVHCSAGVGRTGTIVALDACMRVLSSGRPLSVQQIVKVCAPSEVDPFINAYEAMLRRKSKSAEMLNSPLNPDKTPKISHSMLDSSVIFIFGEFCVENEQISINNCPHLNTPYRFLKKEQGVLLSAF
ncbi:unnamed protein product [Toxocara canis]|uniref:Protein-tyrosine phosphatase n=1 Tax=Toxocara canis TaxID=6265 RepID=A0A183UXE5_TOXCA|nr:unnamed protein product [Toxocara canis]